jgi:hypothetical protein
MREEDGEENGTRTRRKKMEESGYMAGKREENGMGYPTISNDPIDSIFRSPLTASTIALQRPSKGSPVQSSTVEKKP